MGEDRENQRKEKYIGEIKEFVEKENKFIAEEKVFIKREKEFREKLQPLIIHKEEKVKKEKREI